MRYLHKTSWQRMLQGPTGELAHYMKKYCPAAPGRATNNRLCALVEVRHAQCSGESQCKKSIHGASADCCDADPYCNHSLYGSAPHVLRCTTDCQLGKSVHASKHHTRPGDPLLKPADVNLGPSARWAHVEIRQEPNQ